MKQRKWQIWTSLLKGLIPFRKKKADAIGGYAKCIPYVQRLIDTNKLGINLKEKFVVMDVSVHACFAENYPGGSDKKHAAFFDKVIAYMNFQLGRMGKKDFINPKEDVIRFQVTSEIVRYVDEDGNPLPAHLMVHYDTVLVGWYRDGELEYRSSAELESK